MYAGRGSCCLLVSHGEYADRTDGQETDTRPLHYAIRYGRDQRNDAAHRQHSCNVTWVKQYDA